MICIFSINKKKQRTMTKGKTVFAWNEGDIERTKVIYSHQGSVKHWCIVKSGEKVAFDNVSDLPPHPITKREAEKLIFELTGEKREIIKL